MAKPSRDSNERKRRARGFARTSVLLQSRIRKASETRGFAVTRLLTHWEEVAGPDISAISHPVKIGYGREGLGATLTLLTTGANAPMLEMQKERLRERVNACYGYAAVSRIRITQTAATGFAEGQAVFLQKPVSEHTKPDPITRQAAKEAASKVSNQSLREALEALGENVLSQTRSKKGR